MRWRLLGPVQVRTSDGWTGLGASKLRVLLAVLLAEPGGVVSTERLIGELWADMDPPAGGRKLVSQYVFRLRRLIGDHAGRVLMTEPPGYRLAAAGSEVDAGRFGEQLAAAQAALARRDPGRAGDLAAQALGLWRGPALADVPPGPLAAAEAHRLEELRLDAAERRR